jgi:hypothetical protein
MTTYIDEVTLTSGTAKDTFGTAVTFNLNSKAKRVLALIPSGCDTVYTAATGGFGAQLQVTSSSLSLADQRFLTGPYNSSGPATNSSGQGMVPDIISVDWPAAGNEAITLATAPSIALTTALSHMVGIMYCDILPPQDWLAQFPAALPCKGGYVVDAQQLTTTRTALTAINVPTWASEVTSAKGVNLKAAAITAGQSVQSFFEVTSTIPDVTPMKIVTNSEGATLGTPVGGSQYNDWMPSTPIYFQNPGGTQTITPYVNLVAAVSTGNQVLFSVEWR